MIKTSIIALVTVAAMAGVAAPAFATSSLVEITSETSDWAPDTVLTRLQQQGVHATAVEQWGGLVRAFVTLDDGSEVMQFFTPDTLKPVTL